MKWTHDGRTETLTADITFKYWCLHIPTGTKVQRTGTFVSLIAFHAALDSFNASQPGIWQYWSE